MTMPIRSCGAHEIQTSAVADQIETSAVADQIADECCSERGTVQQSDSPKDRQSDTHWHSLVLR